MTTIIDAKSAMGGIMHYHHGHKRHDER